MKLLSNSTFKSFGLVIFSRMFNAAIYLGYTLWLMDVFNVQEYGEYSYYYSIVGVVPFFINLGMDTSFILIGSKLNKADFDSFLKSFWKMKLLICSGLIFISIIYFISTSNELIFISLLCGILFGFSESFKPPAESQKRFNFVSIIIPIRNILLILTTSVFLALGSLSIDNILICLLVANILNILFLILIYNARIAKFSANGKIKINDFFSQAKWIFVRDLMIILMSRIEVFILEFFIEKGRLDEKELGYFSGAFTLCFILPIITNSLTSVLLPTVVRKNTKESFIKYLRKISKSAIIVIPTAIVFYFSVIYAIKLLFGNKYDNSIPLFALIIIATVFTFYTNNISLIFYREKGLKFIAKLNIFQFITSLIISSFLIPRYGSFGAVLSLLIIRIIGFIAVIWKTKKTLSVATL